MLPEKFIPDIEALGIRFNEPELLAQVKHAVDRGKAVPVTYHDTLIIMRPILDHQERMGVLVWVGIHKGRTGISKYFHIVLSMAKATGMHFIRFETKRKGFVKLGARFGYEQIGRRGEYNIYQKEVS